MTRTYLRFLPLFLSVLPACGGGGGGGNGPSSPAVAPTNLVYSTSEVFGISQVALPTLTATHDGDPATFTVTPALPSGLILNPNTGAISGVATAPAPRRVYDVRAANSGGSVHARLPLRIVGPARFLYSTSAVDNSFSTFACDLATGELRRVAQTVTGGTESGPEKLVFHPNGRSAYAPNLATGNVSVFSVDPVSGWLDHRAPAACGAGPHEMVIEPAGRFAYVSNRGSDEIFAYTINPATGDLTQMSAPIAVGAQPSALAVDASGRFLFVTLRGTEPSGTGSELRSFAINASTGALTSAGPALALQFGRPIALTIDSVKPQLFVALESTASVLPVNFDATTGALTAGTALIAGTKPASIDITASGSFTYVANEGDGTLKAFRIDPVSSELSAIGTYAAGTTPTKVVVDPTGSFAYVSAKDSGEILTFAIDAASGVLTQRSSMIVRGAPCDVALVAGDRPTTTVPRFAYSAGVYSGDLWSFTVNPTTGALTPTGTVLTGELPSSIVVGPRRRFAYVSNAFSSTISIFSVNAVNGTLTANLPAQAIAGRPTHLTIDPTARFLYATAHDVVQLDDGWLTAYAINQTTGALTSLGTQEIGSNPTAVAIDPTGRFLYTANNGTGFPNTSGISTFALDPVTGVATNLVPRTVAPGVFDLAFHPDGRHLYGVLSSANSIARFTISRTSGELTAVPPPTSAGIEPVGLAVTPNGRFGFSVALDPLGTGSMSTHSIAADGTLSAPIQTLFDGMHPYDVTVDASGKFMYAANSGSDSLSVVRIDQVTGLMTLGTPVPAGQGVGAVVIASVTQ
ncbi:MAG: beta-propeller fold lactonase family protein [Planctomycetes bacterium]|nr:beta-propeller fold lactonase family protein [Planctomycetota bacterium]